MKIRSLLLINLVLVTYVTAETVYKTVDEEGNIYFSDTPAEGAEVIEIKEAQTINIPETKSFDYTPSKEKQTDVQYTKIVITNPENDSTIQNNEGNVSIKVKIEPALYEKDLIVFFMDGKQVSTGKTLQFSLTNVDRGSHTIDVAVKNEENKLLRRSGKVVFYVRRIARLSPDLAPDPNVISPVNPPKPAITPPNISSIPTSTVIPVP